MSIQSELAQVFQRHGADTALAIAASADAVDRWHKRINRAKRNSELLKDFRGSMADLASRHGSLSRSMLYLIIAKAKSSNNLYPNWTTTEYPANPREA